MASTVEVGAKGTRSSADSLRRAVARSGTHPFKIRVTFQVYGHGDRDYTGLRDHTLRFPMRTRRDFERVHSRIVDLLDHVLREMGYDEIVSPAQHMDDAEQSEALAIETREDDEAIVTE